MAKILGTSTIAVKKTLIKFFRLTKIRPSTHNYGFCVVSIRAICAQTDIKNLLVRC